MPMTEPRNGLNDARQHRLIVADEHPLFRGALREALAGSMALVEIVEAGSFEDVVKLLDLSGDVDLVLLDLAMPGVQGVSGLVYLRGQHPNVPIVIVSADDDPTVIRRCIGLGASG